MKGNPNKWQKLGRIICPKDEIPWMSTFAGPAFAKCTDQSSVFEIIMAGRDRQNRSQLGAFKVNLNTPTESYDVTPEPIFSFGELGAFDENGVSYPWVVTQEKKDFLFYNGWMPSVLTPFQIHLGLAVRNEGGKFKRISRAPILERTNDDYLSTGSVCILIENNTWKMWYTSFRKWGKESGDHKHYYNIKYAESNDGINWRRENRVCIDFKNCSEYAICRPSVIRIDDLYHMWYSYRGEQYRIGYAISEDGIAWQRLDEFAGIDISPSGWDSNAICYSHVFQHKDTLFMLYNGNNYGQEGLGIARLKLF